MSNDGRERKSVLQEADFIHTIAKAFMLAMEHGGKKNSKFESFRTI